MSLWSLMHSVTKTTPLSEWLQPKLCIKFSKKYFYLKDVRFVMISSSFLKAKLHHCIFSNNRPQRLFNIASVRRGTYWRAAFKRKRNLFQSKTRYSHEIFFSLSIFLYSSTPTYYHYFVVRIIVPYWYQFISHG